MTYNIAVVGSTGAVGREMLQTLYERDFPVDNVYALASSKSPGRQVSFGDERTIDVQPIEDFDFSKVDFAFFSAGGDVSEKYAPLAGKNGALVIDNSSAFRMTQNVPLIVPEVNHYDLKGCLSENGGMNIYGGSRKWHISSFTEKTVAQELTKVLFPMYLCIITRSCQIEPPSFTSIWGTSQLYY